MCASLSLFFLLFSFGSLFFCLFCPVLTCLFWFYLISLNCYSLNVYFFPVQRQRNIGDLDGREGRENLGGVLGGKL